MDAPAARTDLYDDAVFTRHTLVVIDFEGLTPQGRPLVPVEVGACAVKAGGGDLAEVWRFESLMAPPAGVTATPWDVRQTGITDAMLATAPPAEQVMAALDDRLTAPPYRLVAHHAATEAALIAGLRSWCPRLAAVPLLDTVRLARHLYPRLPSHSLDTLLAHLDIPRPAGRHRALPDAEVTARLLRRLLAEGGRTRWRSLYDLDAIGGLAPKRPPHRPSEQPGLF
ncbi:3'-5' exonuclease [Nonomuraea sp. NPDC003201]